MRGQFFSNLVYVSFPYIRLLVAGTTALLAEFAFTMQYHALSSIWLSNAEASWAHAELLVPQKIACAAISSVRSGHEHNKPQLRMISDICFSSLYTSWGLICFLKVSEDIERLVSLLKLKWD